MFKCDVIVTGKQSTGLDVHVNNALKLHVTTYYVTLILCYLDCQIVQYVYTIFEKRKKD